jgi:hypothetical protein
VPLKTYDKQADIPKDLEDLYEEQDGKFVPIDYAARAAAALKEEREKRDAAEKAANRTARELAELKGKSAGAAAGKTEAELAKAYKDIEERIREEYAPQVKELEGLRAENRRIKLEDRVKAELRKQGMLDKHLDDCWKLHGEEFDLSTDGKPIVKAEPGKPVDKHVGTIIKQRGGWVQGSRASGGGAAGATTPTGASGGSGPGGRVNYEDLKANPAAAIAQANEG